MSSSFNLSDKGSSLSITESVLVPCVYSAQDCFLNDFHVSHYGSFALKGAGAVMIEATGVIRNGRISPNDAVDVIKSQGSAAGLQIAHAGLKTSASPPFKVDYIESEADNGWPSDIVGPTDLDFADAAIRADKAGVDILEIHGAHGFFLSRNFNKRDDDYGGPSQNRIRLYLEIVQAIRAVLPEHKPLWLRISCTDYVNPVEYFMIRHTA